MPDFGTVLRIFSDRFVNKVSYMQKNIYWARFWNITCKQNFGIWKGTFSDSGGVRLLSNKDDSVVDRLKMYDSRIANRVRRRPMASIPSSVTDVEYEDAGYASLMKSLTHHDVLLLSHFLQLFISFISVFDLV
ncbi:Protection of telomeres protein 1b [Zea mays]|uniref:Protection of telomeres protein 1b n=1 Tax=Zea mays TaxID=4577 RepID=A0A1D6JHZ1_MAIZE|nr:Protection of telomeres protein 1b [Zea mays]